MPDVAIVQIITDFQLLREEGANGQPKILIFRCLHGGAAEELDLLTLMGISSITFAWSDTKNLPPRLFKEKIGRERCVC